MKDVTENSGRWKIAAAVSVILAALLLIPSLRFDCFNLFAAAAALYLAVRIGRGWTVSSSSRLGRRLLAATGRSVVILVIFFAAAEFVLRAASLHRSLVYESHGDLLWTPDANQEYVEKISLSPSHTDRYGLRAGVSPAGRRVILCLGDSITYGYGVDDTDTYPARLQLALDQYEPGKYAVLNGGVNAYPIWLMHQKFLYLWKDGIHPSLVIVGYSMNEGPLTQLAMAPLTTKAQFTQRVKWKNYVRQLALYNFVFENWARYYYGRMKYYLMPGTHLISLRQALWSTQPMPASELADISRIYERQLEIFTADLRQRHVPVIFVLFCSYDEHTRIYDAGGPFQIVFANFAEKHHLQLFSSEAALRDGLFPSADLTPYFIDASHMNAKGTDKFGRKLAAFLETRDLLENGKAQMETGNAGPAAD